MKLYTEKNSFVCLIRRVLLRPLSRIRVVFLPVPQVLLGDFRDKRVIRVRVRQQTRYRQQHLRYRERRRPLVLQYVQAYASVAVHVAVVDFGDEVHFRRLERVVGREGDIQKEYSAGVR